MAGISRDTSTAPQGSGSTGINGKGSGLRGMRYINNGSMEPTVIYLMLLILVEIIGYGFLRYAFRSVHGG